MHSIGQRIRLWRNGHDAPNGIVLRLFRCGTVNDNALEANKKSTWSFVTGGSPTRLRDTTRMMAISCSRAVVASGDGEGEFRLRTARAGAGRRCRAALPALQPPRCGTQITDMPGVAAAALRRHAADRQMADAREVAGAHAQPARLRTSSFAALETTPLAQTSSDQSAPRGRNPATAWPFHRRCCIRYSVVASSWQCYWAAPLEQRLPTQPSSHAGSCQK